MGYIKKKYRVLLSEIDNQYNYNIPNDWNDFVQNIANKNHNLVIRKSHHTAICTNCRHEFSTTKKVGQYQQCPNCKNTYLVKLNNLKHYEFYDIAVLLDKVDTQLVMRIFEIKSTYSKNNYKFTASCVEYARILPLMRDCIFVNDRVSKNTGPVYIYHYSDFSEWRKYTRYYGLSSKGYVYPNNLKRILQNTEYQYSMIWELAKHIKYLDIEPILEEAKYSNKIEMLTKAKLYNLAMECHSLSERGNFEKIFGVPKSLYPFMKKYNITRTQLELLKILKEPNIRKIRYLQTYGDHQYEQFSEIDTYIGINRFIKYSKIHHHKVDVYLYKDYLRFASLLGFDLKDNKYAFPKNLKSEHDKLEKQYKIQNEKLINDAILKRYQELNKNKFKDKNYIIMPAPSLAALKDESSQQHNCVRTYAENYAAGQCDIYFMRDINQQDKSLVTVEVNHNKIIQSRSKYNNSINKHQDRFLKKWEQKVLKGAA